MSIYKNEEDRNSDLTEISNSTFNLFITFVIASSIITIAAFAIIVFVFTSPSLSIVINTILFSLALITILGIIAIVLWHHYRKKKKEMY